MFRTKVDLPKYDFGLHHQQKILSMGSCFSENMGSRLTEAAFDVKVNPFGVLYNPASIAKSLDNLLHKSMFTSSDLMRNGELWASFSHSTLYSATHPDACLELINKDFLAAKYQLANADVLLLTLGTAWVFEFQATREIVSNCHKIPSAQFNRRRLTVAEIVETYRPLLRKLCDLNTELKIIFTVSPVRHWKDGPTENNISKAILLMAIQDLQTIFPYNIFYFPSYEIVVDELRDYRFYASDMLHPSDVAIDYIWEKLTESLFDIHTKKLCDEIIAYRNMCKHRPIHKDTIDYQKFLQAINNKLEMLITTHPWLTARLGCE